MDIFLNTLFHIYCRKVPEIHETLFRSILSPANCVTDIFCRSWFALWTWFQITMSHITEPCLLASLLQLFTVGNFYLYIIFSTHLQSHRNFHFSFVSSPLDPETDIRGPPLTLITFLSPLRENSTQWEKGFMPYKEFHYSIYTDNTLICHY